MLGELFFDVLQHEGVVAIATWGAEPHLVNTWNSYIQVVDGRSLLIPAGGMQKTEKNLSANNRVLLTLGTREVNGKRGQQGAGFLVSGTAEFVSTGEDFERVKSRFPWARAALRIAVESATQTL